MGLELAFHSPRSLRILTRSKRFRTERLPPTVPVALSEECLDMTKLVKVYSPLGLLGRVF